ncbi:substrate-binding periplasmic protein [Pseudaeromonas sharmana]|uniref:Substrate-binding periplasmic protein n=1 Tax=Pseudaeromonas sharmana TaxID=328412 RepID=A0ABV8CLG3_9GAMM
MKRAGQNACLVLISLFLWGSRAEPACQQIHYAANPAYPPYHWSPDNQHYTGASEALLRKILPPGVEAIPVVYPWKRTLELARQGKIDLILSLRRTPEREQFLSFLSAPSFSNPIAVFVQTSLSEKLGDLRNWQALIPLRGGISRGDTFGGEFDDFLRDNLTVEEASTMTENFQKLRRGRIDYFITSLHAGNFYLNVTGYQHEIVALSPPVSNEEIFFAFSRSSPCLSWSAALTQRMQEMGEQGEIDALLVPYL